MNPMPPSTPPPRKSSSCATGCLVTLAVVVALFIGGIFVARYLFVSTPTPFKLLASLIEKGDPNIKFTGISGDIATGPSVESITWGGNPAHRSEILGLRAKYNGLSGIQATRRVIIEDVGVRKAHIDLAGWQSSGSAHGHRSSSRSSSSSSKSEWPKSIDSVEIQQVLFEDVLITNSNTAFQLSIPKISWVGFKMTENDLEPGDLNVESDRLLVKTGPGRTLPMGDQSVTFKKSIAVTALPLLHPSIKKNLDLTYDFTFVPGTKSPAFHASALGGKVDAGTVADGGSALHIKHLDLASLLDAQKLYGKQAAEFPSDFSIEAQQAAEDGPTKVTGGSFVLGKATFAIDPVEIEKDNDGKATLRATTRVEGNEIHWSLPLDEIPFYFRPTFTANPEMSPKQILAHVFAGKPVDDLSDDEKAAIEARVPVYFPTKEP